MPVEQKMIQQAFKFALDPTPAQQRRLASHAGAARYAYNWGVTRIAEARQAWAAEKAAGIEKPATEIPNHFALCKAWTAYKDDPDNGLHWVGENFSGTYQAALRESGPGACGRRDGDAEPGAAAHVRPRRVWTAGPVSRSASADNCPAQARADGGAPLDCRLSLERSGPGACGRRSSPRHGA